MEIRFSGRTEEAVAVDLPLGTLAVITVAVVVVSVPHDFASAATPLQTGDAQAYGSLTLDGLRTMSPNTGTFRGPLTLSFDSGVAACTNSTFGVTANISATALITTAAFSNCTTKAWGCSVAKAAAREGQGSRLVANSQGAPRGQVNGGTAPAQGVTWSRSDGCPCR